MTSHTLHAHSLLRSNNLVKQLTVDNIQLARCLNSHPIPCKVVTECEPLTNSSVGEILPELNLSQIPHSLNAHSPVTPEPHVSAPTVYTFLCTEPRSMAPHTPRVVLLGPTGSGKSLQALHLARTYHLVSVDCREVIRRTLTSGSKIADKMKPFHERGMMSECTL